MNDLPLIVGGEEISAQAIAAELQNHPASEADQAWQQARRALAVRQLLLNEASRLGIAGEDETDERGQRLTEGDAAIEALLRRELHTPQADEESCRRYYDNHRDRFVAPGLIEAAHILIAADPEDPLAMGLAVSDARAMIEEISADPGRFEELARERSACPSGAQGGNLGQVQRGQMVAAFEQALFAASAPGLCPQPVKTGFGVHVIRAGRRTAEMTLPFEAVRDAIADYLEEASYRHAAAQYVAILAEAEGLDLDDPG